MNTLLYSISLIYSGTEELKKRNCHLFPFSYEEQMAFSPKKYLKISVEENALCYTEVVMKL